MIAPIGNPQLVDDVPCLSIELPVDTSFAGLAGAINSSFFSTQSSGGGQRNGIASSGLAIANVGGLAIGNDNRKAGKGTGMVRLVECSTILVCGREF